LNARPLHCLLSEKVGVIFATDELDIRSQNMATKPAGKPEPAPKQGKPATEKPAAKKPASSGKK
jgi:hypothetical protein